jgi:23S rRNA pseudouridine1911/1915/1917 synthase
MKKIIYSVKQEDKPDLSASAERLDIFISLKCGLSRSYIQKLIQKGLLLVNSKIQKAGYKIKPGQQIVLTIPDEPEISLDPEDIPLHITLEDEHIVVVDKPAHMVIYPSFGHKKGTLLNALLSKCRKLASTGAPLRPGVVHRLDKETSGLIVLAKDNAAYSALVEKFKEREIEKHYLALLYGRLKTDRGEIRTAIGRSVSDRKKMSTKTRKGKEAITQFEVIKRFKSATLAKVRIITGRTHQIRVHFAASGNPVLGDKTYGKKTSIKSGQKTINFPRQMLHAYSLKFEHPVTGEPLELTAPMPDDMKKAIEELSE